MTVERIANTDFKSLHELKLQAKDDAKKALPEVAKQFEGIFLQSMLKAMRASGHFLEKDSPFRGKNTETFQDMLDGQYVSKINSSPNGIGLAEMLTKQLGNKVGNSHKAVAMGHTDKMVIGAKDTDSSIPPISVQKSKLADVQTSPTTLIDDFVKSIWAKAKQAAASMGLDPKVLIAQAALETGWGQSITKDSDGSTSNNLFNIKSGNNTEFDSINIKTTEYIADTPIKVSAAFRKYSSVEDSFNDYVSLIKGNERYQNAVANAGNPERYVDELSKAGYATDPNYGSKILSIYHSNELNQAMQRCGLSDEI